MMPPPEAEPCLDLRGLPPPEPMERVLDALDALPPGGSMRMRIDREPVPLYRILEGKGYHYETRRLADDVFDVVITQQV